MTTDQPRFDDVAILVPSCDRYSSLWTYSVNWIRKNRVLSAFPLYITSNSLIAKEVISLNVGTQGSWSDELILALQKIPHSYIILLLDDLISSNDQINDDQLTLAIKDACEQAYDYLRFVDLRNKTSVNPRKKAYINQISREFPYRLSLLPAVWKKSTLISLLQSGESAWDFERNGSVRSRSYVNWMACSSTLIGTYNLIIKGKCYLRDIQRSGINRPSLDFPDQDAIERLFFTLNVIKHKLWIQVLHYLFILKN